MKMNKIKKIYEKVLFSQKPKVQEDDAQKIYLSKYKPFSKESTILDAGCGNARYTLLLKSMGVNYLAFGGDAAAKNSQHTEYIKKKVGNNSA